MVEAPRRPRLPAESVDVLGSARQRRMDDLERDVPLQAGVAGAVNLAHASDAEQAHDLVGTEAVAGREGNVGLLRRHVSLIRITTPAERRGYQFTSPDQGNTRSPCRRNA